MDTQSLLATLSIVTLAVVAAAGVWQWTRVRASQRRRGETPSGGLNDL